MKSADWRSWWGFVAALIFSGCSDCDLPPALICTGGEPCTCIQDFDCPGTDQCYDGLCVPFGTGDVGVDADGLDADGVDADGVDADSGLPDAGDTDADADATPDTDVETDTLPNECGGTEELVWMGEPAAVGESCGDCSAGSLVCDGEDAVGCEGIGEFNECGGCGEITERLGLPCGDCGVMQCEGGDAACVDDLGDECPDPLTRRFRLEPSAGDLGDGAENDRFGWTIVSTPDGGLFIGAPEDDTSAFAAGRVFELVEDGGWRVIADIQAPDAVEGDKFGESLAFDAATLVVGAPAADRDEPGSGAVFVYVRTASGWELETTLQSPAAMEGGGYGRSVGISGDWIAVGEESRDGPDGQVHLYKRTDGEWAPHSVVIGVGGVDEGDRFGYSLVLDGADLVVGATVEADFRGGAHAFRLVGDAWISVELPVHPEAVPLSNFGFSLALSEDRETLLIAAHLDNTEVSEGGAFFAYSRTEDGWAPGARVTAAEPTESSRFGSSIAHQDGRIFVGAFREPASGPRSGSVHIFEEGATGWEEIAVVDPAGTGNRLGYSIAITPDGRIASGAVRDGAGAEDGGAVYVFEDGAAGWERQARILSPRALAEGSFARSVAIEGPTVVIGADESSRFAIRGGAAHVFYRTRDGWEPETVLGPADLEDLSRFGNAMAMNRDWLVVSARNATATEPRAGAVYVYSRTDDRTFAEFARLTSPSPVAGGRFGASVAVDGDQLIIGEDRERTDPDLPGTAWVFAFDGDNWALDSELADGAMQTVGLVGQSVGIHGDTALVGAPGHDAGDGAAFRFDRGDSGWAFTQVIAAPEASANMGTSVALTETELLIGATSGNGAEASSGAVFVFEREASNASGSWASDVAGTSSRFGTALTVEDTLAVVGADRGPVGGSPDGTVTVFSSDAGSWTQIATIDAEDEGVGESFGYSVDLNLGRALVGAVEDDVDGRNAGAAYVLE